MASLSFDRSAPPASDIDTLSYFGVAIRINTDFTDADLVDFMEAAGEADENDPRSALLLKKFLREVVVHPDDFDLFWATGKANRQSLEDRMAVAYQIIEAVTKRPTGQPSGSPAGQRTTAGNSTADFALAAQRKLESAGRADLAVAALRHREALEAG